MNPLRRHGPAAGAVLLYWAVCFWLYSAVMSAAGGAFTYVLDDAYIHMAMARNLAEHGTWGVNPGEFASASSSPLWTALLGGVYALRGPSELAPLALNLLAGALALLAFHRLLIAEGLRARSRSLLLAAFVFVTPLPAMAFTGQEHTLHILLTLAFLFPVLGALSGPVLPLGRRGAAALALAAAALTACRYEGAFLAFAAGLLFAFRGDWRRFLIVGVASSAPILAYGALSVSKGWAFLPNSLMLKGIHLDFSSAPAVLASMGGTAVRQLWQNGHLLTAFLAGLLFLLLAPPAPAGTGDRRRAAVILFLASLLLHLQFARVGWFYRYEAWLVALGLAALAACAAGRWWSPPDRHPLRLAAAAGLAFFAIVPFALRAYGALAQVPGAARNIFEQQRQTAELLRRSFPGATVAVNDIGAVAYYGGVRVLDLWGLSTMEVAHHKLDRTYTTAVIGALVQERGVEIAIVYDDWFQAYGGFPRNWEKAGKWTIRDNIVCGRDTVVFYATTPAATERLTAALRAYGPHLPLSLQQSGPYLER
jgi:hypothetical protein